VYQREARDEELDMAFAFLNGAVGSSVGPSGGGRLEQLIQMLLVSNEFLFLE
jgi:hypothetical protein